MHVLGCLRDRGRAAGTALQHYIYSGRIPQKCSCRSVHCCRLELPLPRGRRGLAKESRNNCGALRPCDGRVQIQCQIIVILMYSNDYVLQRTFKFIIITVSVSACLIVCFEIKISLRRSIRAGPVHECSPALPPACHCTATQMFM